ALALASATGLAAALAGGVAAAVAGLLALALAALVVASLPRAYPHGRLGLCNLVTLFRAGLVAALAGLLVAGLHGWPVLLVAAAGLALDGADGWLARREGLVSAFGARADMETDAALALVLAGHVWMAGLTGPEILILGLMRYVFVACFWPFPWLAAPLPDRFGRKVVCVVQVAALIVLQVPDLPRGLAALVAWPAVAALLWSFGRDTLWLWRHRG
ncbi:MAG: hypothetical protein RIR62_3348, partial [Pseudomonadota bacterium]